jgi:2-keto-4-pentenoate hydratase
MNTEVGAAYVDLDALVRDIDRASRERCVTAAPSDRYPAFSLADGFEVGRRLSTWRVATGETHGGVKIGLTYEPAWSQLGSSNRSGPPSMKTA